VGRGDAGARVDQAGEHRLARFESLRALAALGVLGSHAWGEHHSFTPAAYDGHLDRLVFGGGYGVYVFFALSGYLLFRPLARAAFGDGQRIDLGDYGRNRVLRIVPLYYAVAAILFVLSAGGGSPSEWLRFATFSQNFFSGTVLALDSPMWSLIVEVQFYALLPLLALGLAWVSRRDLRVAAGVLVALGLAGVALRSYLLRPTVDDPRIVYSLATTSFFFVPGLLLALARIGWDRRGGALRLPGPLGSSDAWALAAIAAWIYVIERFDVEPLVTVATFLTLGAIALPLRPGRFAAILDWRPLALVGVVSYSLYLWHLPLVNFIGEHISRSLPLMLGAVAASIALAFLSYRVIEAPFLRLRRRWARRAEPADVEDAPAGLVTRPA